MGGGGEFEAAADHRAMQGRDKGDRPARDDIEHRMPGVVVLFARQRRLHVFQELREVEAGGEVDAVAEDDPCIRFVAGAHHRIA
jgi:hypothetical protein